MGLGSCCTVYKATRAKQSGGVNTDKVQTPTWLLHALEEEFGELSDPCPIEWCEDNDPCALAEDGVWSKDLVNYVNPPFSDISPFVRRAIQMYLSKGCKSVALVPARTESRWFHDLAFKYAAEIRFIRGRVKFDGFKRPSPEGVCLLMFTGPQPVSGPRVRSWEPNNLHKTSRLDL